MAWFPLTGAVVQRVLSTGKPAVGYVLKPYAAGTSTPIAFATDATGGTQLSYGVYNSAGDLTNPNNNAVIIPHIDQNFRLALYPSQSAADSNTGAIWTTLDIDLASIGYTLSALGVTATAAELNILDGATITTPQLNDIANKVVGPASSLDNEIVLYDGASGKLLKRALTSGILKADAGVIGAAVSGEDFKTINGLSILGAGDIPPLSQVLNRNIRTSNTQLLAIDIGKYFDITSGTFTQTFDTGNFAVGWYAYIGNSGTGDITIPSSDGVTNWIMYQGEIRVFQWDGSALNSFVVKPFLRVFTSSGTFTKPPGYSAFGGLLWGGGGSGGRSGSGQSAGGGGGGACLPFSIRATWVGATETVTIGAGGAVVTTIGPGSAGGTSSFGSLFSAYGGGGGGGSTAAGWAGGGGGGALSVGITSGGASPGIGGSPKSNASGAQEGTGLGGAAGDGFPSAWGGAGGASNAAGGNSVYGGGGGGSGNNPGGAGGTSYFGGGGGAGTDTTNGTPGSQPGGGGGGTRTGTQSGAGGAGQLNIWGEV